MCMHIRVNIRYILAETRVPISTVKVLVGNNCYTLAIDTHVLPRSRVIDRTTLSKKRRVGRKCGSLFTICG